MSAELFFAAGKALIQQCMWKIERGGRDVAIKRSCDHTQHNNSVAVFVDWHFVSCRHMIACTLLSTLMAVTGAVPSQHITSARQFGKVTVLALVFCLSVVLGNVSLKLIPVSFNQVGIHDTSGWPLSRLHAVSRH